MQVYLNGSIFLALILVMGCAKTNPSDCNLTTNICACNRTTASEYPDCRDYEAISVEKATTKCASATGAFSTAALCSTTSRVGTCKFTVGNEATYQRYYTGNYSTAASAAAVCAYYKANCFVLGGNALCDGVWSSDI